MSRNLFFFFFSFFFFHQFSIDTILFRLWQPRRLRTVGVCWVSAAAFHVGSTQKGMDHYETKGARVNGAESCALPANGAPRDRTVALHRPRPFYAQANEAFRSRKFNDAIELVINRSLFHYRACHPKIHG